MNLKSLYYILSTLLLMVCTMSFGSCSKDNVEEVDNVAKNVCFKVEVRTGGYGAETRAAGPSVSVSAMLPCPLLFIIIPLPPNQNQ